MKISVSCIRDLLISIEDACTITACFEYDKENKPPALLDYAHDQIVYHAIQCNDAELFKGFDINDTCSSFFVGDLSPKGHALINQLRDDTIWNQIMEHGFSSVPDMILFIIGLLGKKRKESNHC